MHEAHEKSPDFGARTSPTISFCAGIGPPASALEELSAGPDESIPCLTASHLPSLEDTAADLRRLGVHVPGLVQPARSGSSRAFQKTAAIRGVEEPAEKIAPRGLAAQQILIPPVSTRSSHAPGRFYGAMVPWARLVAVRTAPPLRFGGSTFQRTQIAAARCAADIHAAPMYSGDHLYVEARRRANAKSLCARRRITVFAKRQSGKEGIGWDKPSPGRITLSQLTGVAGMRGSTS